MKIYDARLQRQQDIHWIKQTIWVYFFLLLFEGALRKWILPSLSTPLLLVRDPVVMVTYFLAWRSGLFPRNVFIGTLVAIAVPTFLIALLTAPESPIITLYGFRSNFLAWPLMFIIAKVFTSRDVERMGYWFLLLTLPMTLLMVLQFLAPPSSFLNTGATEGSEQIASALGRIRPAGTFSYITGPVLYFAPVTAFLLYNQFNKCYPTWLMAAATVATLCAVAVSGSRSLVAGIGIVFIFGLAGSLVFRPQVAFRWLGGLLVLGIVAFFLRDLPFMSSGIEVLFARAQGASDSEGGVEGFLARYFSSYIGVYPALFEASYPGKGLGLGTLVGQALLSNRANAVQFEGDWVRHVLESGPILGLALVCYRIALTCWLSSVCIRYMARRDPLPVLLLGSCVTLVLIGSLGQATMQGFTVLLAGLCLAATHVPKTGRNASTMASASAQTQQEVEIVNTENDLSLAR